MLYGGSYLNRGLFLVCVCFFFSVKRPPSKCYGRATNREGGPRCREKLAPAGCASAIGTVCGGTMVARVERAERHSRARPVLALAVPVFPYAALPTVRERHHRHHRGAF